MTRRQRTASGPGAGAFGPPAPTTATQLRRILDQLGAAKGDLLEASAALRAVDGRVRTWDLGQPFMARRSRALRGEATIRFGDALDRLHVLLQRMPDQRAGAPGHTIPRRLRNRRLLVAIRGQLRYLQRAFDGGSLLLAKALASFSTTGL